jgi:hypothetical protein
MNTMGAANRLTLNGAPTRLRDARRQNACELRERLARRSG